MLVDTHCHIHEAAYPLDPEAVLERARAADVQKMICVGTSDASSNAAYQFAINHDNTYFSVGIHPHDTHQNDNGGNARNNVSFLHALVSDCVSKGNGDKLVAVGEIGLDYYYMHSPKNVQIEALTEQLSLAKQNDLPVIFHVRDAFDDFWPIFDNFHGMRGVLHSFTDSEKNLEEGLSRGLYVGLNGISTFTKDPHQQAMFRSIPLEKVLLETDAPFLTPTPKRGTINEPAFVRLVAEFCAQQRGITLNEIARTTTANASALFAL